MPRVSSLLLLPAFAFLIAGCGGGDVSGSEPRVPADADYIPRRFGSKEMDTFQVLKVETPPPGYKPLPKLEACDLGMATAHEYIGKRLGVVTLVRAEAPRGARITTTVEHVDDSAPLFSHRGPLRRDGKADVDIVFPIVGAKGERLSVVYRRDDAAGWGVWKPLGPPMQRLELICEEEGHYVGIAAAEPGLHIPLSEDGNLPKVPAGVAGAKRIYGGWIVQWRGDKEGVSFIKGYDISKLTDATPRYVRLREDKLESTKLWLGEKSDGTCDALLAGTSLEGIPEITPGPDCKSALATLEPKVAEGLAMKKAAYAKSDAELAQWNAEYKKRQEQREAEKKIEEDKKAAQAALDKKEQETRDKEMPLIKKYAEHRAAARSLEACMTISVLPVARHIKFVSFLAANGLASYADADCLLQRHPPKSIAEDLERLKGDLLARDKARRAEEEEAEAERRRAQRRAEKRQQAAQGPSPPSHQQQMNRVNDYLYGSGNASSCPLRDKSYCY